MVFGFFAKALHEEANMSKRKLMKGLGNYTDIPGHLFRLRKQSLLQFQVLTFLIANEPCAPDLSSNLEVCVQDK